MIRVNLLPRDPKGRRLPTLSLPVSALALPAVVLGAAALILAGTALSQQARLGALGQSLARVEAESRELAPQIERVNRLARERAELDLRLGIIHQLEKGRVTGVRLMDELARCVPDHLWLTAASGEGESELALEGMTFSNLVVSDFMSRLERSPWFTAVELGVAERGQVSNRDVVKFRITCQVSRNETTP